MKRFFILASAAIVALASCAKTEVVYKDAPQEIAFKQVTGAMTKAPALTTDMGVFAWTSETTPQNYFGLAKKFAADGTIWKANPAQYYPLQTALDFACYAPYSGLLEWSYDNGTQTLASPAIDDVKAIDVLYGERIYADCGTTPDAVPVLFKHALAKVTVKVQSNVPGTITVNSVTLTDICTGGKVTVDYDSDSWKSTVWSDKAGVANYVWTKADSFTLTEDAQEFGPSINFVPGDSQNVVNQTSFEVSYTMNSVTMTASVGLTGVWEMGKHYTYTLNAKLNEITFDPEVEVMATVTPEAIAL